MYKPINATDKLTKWKHTTKKLQNICMFLGTHLRVQRCWHI